MGWLERCPDAPPPHHLSHYTPTLTERPLSHYFVPIYHTLYSFITTIHHHRHPCHSITSMAHHDQHTPLELPHHRLSHLHLSIITPQRGMSHYYFVLTSVNTPQSHYNCSITTFASVTPQFTTFLLGCHCTSSPQSTSGCISITAVIICPPPTRPHRRHIPTIYIP